MSLTISIPDEVASVLGAEPVERERRAREAIALELYREGRISLRTMGKLAGVGDDYWAADQLRVSYGIPVTEIGEDRDSNEKVIKRLAGS